MKGKIERIVVIAVVATLVLVGNSGRAIPSSDLFRMQEQVQSRSDNFENPTGTRGNGGRENQGAKGHAFERLTPGERKVLFDFHGCGIINRIWFTLGKQDPRVLRSLKIEMYWDDAKTPAVQAPFGDFFCDIFGKTSSFENYFFSNPEGRSFNCYAQMPFRKAAKIVLTNESTNTFNMYYDVDFTLTGPHDASVMYFHAWWNRVPATELGKDFVVLPTVQGKGRYLGAHIGLMTNPLYTNAWWGEGEVKIYLDGDTEYPTIAGTGSEDYPGSGYGLGKFNHRFQGCLVADNKKGEYGFYRYHVPDPIFFHKNCRVTLQQIGGGTVKQVMELVDKGASLKLVSFTPDDTRQPFLKFLEMPAVPDLKTLPDGWVNFYRSDDLSAVAFFYLDSPEDGLPQMAGADLRTQGVGN
jgi:D-arabinan exo alpha-(1,3)/(1,5)-arabinofuranosidase (non-reducing end)